MGTKFWFVGATLVLATALVGAIPAANVVGSVLMVIGAVLICLDK